MTAYGKQTSIASQPGGRIILFPRETDMNRQEISSTASLHADHFCGPATTSCADCEVRFPLQILVAELLCKNQLLRLELQEARSRLNMAEEG
jgi:hypothetical protein